MGEEKHCYSEQWMICQLSRGTVYDWSAENINWVIPHWTVADSLADEYDNGVLIADKYKERTEIILKVTDPFLTSALGHPVKS